MKPQLKYNTKLLIAISLTMGLIITIVMELISYKSNKHILENNNAVYRYYKTLEIQHDLLVSIYTLEGDEHKFLLTNDTQILQNFNQQEIQIRSLGQSILKYTSSGSDSIQMSNLIQMIETKIEHINNTINNPDRSQSSISKIVEDKEDKKLMTDFLLLDDKIDTEMQAKIQSLRIANAELSAKTNFWDIFGTLFAILVLIIAMFFLFKDVDLRDELEIKLRIAKMKAEQNAVLKEQFMANMSHEIRTPMNAILGFTNLMEKTKLDDIQSEYISAVKSSGANLLNIINDILDFSKIEAGMLRIEKIPFSIPSLLNSLEVMFAEKTKEKNLMFSVNVDEHIPQIVLGDPTRLTQIMINLIGNAIKFTQQGKVSVFCDLISLEDGLAKIIFKVKDTGEGIPKEKQIEIFDRFNQGNLETTRQYGGTRLGLAIVKKLVELQNGTISLQSREGKGSEFTIEISYSLPKEYVSKETGETEAMMPNFSEAKINILLVEDNIMNQKYASILLKELGADVDIAQNGQIAIEMLKNKKYNLILMDIQMPVMDGYKTASVIRGELHLKTPIIAMTAHIMAGEKEKCAGFGMNDYISKPFNESDLYKIISKYLGDIAKTNKSATTVSEEKTKEDIHQQVIDLSELQTLSKGNKAFVKEMIGIFLEQVPLDMNDIEAAIKETDYDTIQAISHKMKTSVGFIGLRPLLQEPLNTIESLSENHEGLEKIANKFNYLKSIIEKAERELELAIND